MWRAGLAGLAGLFWGGGEDIRLCRRKVMNTENIEKDY
jgi:hypothetical protein